MKKLLLFIAGISILFLAGCSNGNQSHGNEGMGDSLPADPPLGYVIELKPLGNFSHQEAEQLREELVKQLGIIFNKVPKAELEASVFVRRQERNTCLMSLQTKKQVLGWGILKMLHEEHGGNDEIVTIGLTHRDISTSIHGQYNYGIMGLSFRPGDACVVSTFRLKRKDDLWKVTIHKFLHSRGLPHCK